jgi:hypothetical protein
MLSRFLRERLRPHWLRVSRIEADWGVISWLITLGGSGVTALTWLFGGSEVAQGVAAVVVTAVALFVGTTVFGWTRGWSTPLGLLRQTLPLPQGGDGQLPLPFTDEVEQQQRQAVEDVLRRLDAFARARFIPALNQLMELFRELNDGLGYEDKSMTMM